VIRHRDRKLFLASTKRSGNPSKCVTQEGKKRLIRESFFSSVICDATHSGWLKAPDLGLDGSFVIRESGFWNSIASVRAHSAPSVTGGSTGELEEFA
jgi:hypothetical protein